MNVPGLQNSLAKLVRKKNMAALNVGMAWINLVYARRDINKRTLMTSYDGLTDRRMTPSVLFDRTAFTLFFNHVMKSITGIVRCS